MNYLKTFLPYLFGNKKGKSLVLPSPIPWGHLNFEEMLMFHALQHSLNSYVNSLDLNTLSKKDVFHLFNFLEFLNRDLKEQVEVRFSDLHSQYQQAIKRSEIKLNELQELIKFKTNTLTLFAVLKTDRRRKGKLLVRKADGQFMTDGKGKIWSIPVLGMSRRGLPFNHSNGHTPSGVFTIDSVMPEANKQKEFGSYRRLIVNFIKPSQNEENLLKFLPRNHHGLSWWTPSVVGRELGRSLLRIHGTGRKNHKIFAPYYPIVPTSGCLATNESSLLGFKKIHHQRLLLDVLMEAMNLPAAYENESKIHGLLYVIEFDDNLGTLRF